MKYIVYVNDQGGIWLEHHATKANAEAAVKRLTGNIDAVNTQNYNNAVATSNSILADRIGKVTANHDQYLAGLALAKDEAMQLAADKDGNVSKENKKAIDDAHAAAVANAVTNYDNTVAETSAEMEAHIATFIEPTPAEAHILESEKCPNHYLRYAWVINGDGTVTLKDEISKDEIIAAITMAEASVTDRRRREAETSEEGKAWLEANYAAVAELRDMLTY